MLQSHQPQPHPSIWWAYGIIWLLNWKNTTKGDPWFFWHVENFISEHCKLDDSGFAWNRWLERPESFKLIGLEIEFWLFLHSMICTQCTQKWTTIKYYVLLLIWWSSSTWSHIHNMALCVLSIDPQFIVSTWYKSVQLVKYQLINCLGDRSSVIAALWKALLQTIFHQIYQPFQCLFSLHFSNLQISPFRILRRGPVIMSWNKGEQVSGDSMPLRSNS